MSTFADYISSGALGAVVVAAGFLLRHDGQIKSLLNLLPAMAKDAATARTAVESSGVAPYVHKVEAELSSDARAALDGVVARLEALAAPMSGGTDASADSPDNSTVPADAAPSAAVDPAPEVEPAPVASIAGVPDGTYVLRDGQLRPAGA